MVGGGSLFLAVGVVLFLAAMVVGAPSFSQKVLIWGAYVFIVSALLLALFDPATWKLN